ncbi:MAG: O-antigen ligase family protein [Elusimicrobiota bacterium]
MLNSKITKILDNSLFVGFLILAAGSAFSIALATGAIFLLLLIWLSKIFYSGKNYCWQKTFLNWPLYIFLLTGLVSCFAGIDPKHSLYEFRSQYLVLIFFLTVNNLSEEKQLKNIVKYFLIFSALVSLFGMMQYFIGINKLGETFFNIPDGLKHLPPKILKYLTLHDGRVVATRSHPITFGEGLIFPLAIIISYFFALGKEKKIILALGGVIILIALILSQSRGAWLGMLGVILVMETVKLRKFPYWGAGLILLIGLLIFSFRASEITERARSIFNLKTDVSNTSRLTMWRTGLNIFKDYPVLGIGPGNVEKLYSQYCPPNPNSPKTWSELHNNFLQIAVERGIIGLIAFLTLLASYIIVLRKSWDHPFICASLSSLAGLLIAGLTESNFHDAEIVIIFYLIMGLSAVWAAKKT